MQNRKRILMILGLITAFIGSVSFGIMWYANSVDASKAYKVIKSGAAICTMNVPPSSCGESKVVLQDDGGNQYDYKISGFTSRRNGEKIEKISLIIGEAREQNKKVYIRLSGDTIIKAQLVE